MDILEDGNYTLIFNDTYTYIRLDDTSFVRFGKQGDCDSILWSAPESLCDYDPYCGPYSLCTLSGSGSCICPVGFNSVSTDAWITAGCSRNDSLNCENVEVTFYPIDGIHRYPLEAFALEVTNMSECESACLRDCTCTAFAYNASCLLWFSELRNTIVLDSGLNGIRISKPYSARTVGDHGSLVVFSFAQIKNSTKRFSEKLGEGGFGCVFKGMLPGCTPVAVKKLKDHRQDEKQFRAEVRTIGMIQHINIVRLLGFCAEELCPKIADFGMAKLLGRDYSRVLTTVRGTIGYLAPEWISGLPITHKADVYSFGMILLEILSGRRNSEKIEEGRFTYFPSYVAVKLSEGDDVMWLLDSSLESNADAEQLQRACRVACWCIQDAEDHRPMMGQAVHMLEGAMDAQVPPVPRSLQNYVGVEDSTTAEFYISEGSC
ncbi:receptor-like protein kinase 4 [Zea mays]|uniref:Receptor-like protein kinase 4 n=1 Tax=Zea mays TaxID=4577 RepID=A0A1D6MFC2_MAIZE|nr:receptor-like protein kinase 4 [Zea mays]